MKSEEESLNTATLDTQYELVQACQNGDRSAQSKLVQKYQKAMYNICIRMLKDSAAAEDALQEAFISAFRNLKSFEGRATFGAWFKRIVINKCLSILQKQKIIFEEYDDKYEPTQPEMPEGLMSEELSLTPGHVQEAIMELPKGCRQVFVLYLMEGYDHQEISEIMHISVSTSKSQLHRAKKLLQSKLTRHSN